MLLEALLETSFLPLEPYSRGKVRNIYALGKNLLIVTTDRISAFDVILPNGIPGKGRILTKLSEFWFLRTQQVVPNHLISTDPSDLPDFLYGYTHLIEDRFMLVRKAQRIDVECVVRGYLVGSAWEEYRRSGTVCGQRLPQGLRESEKFPEPVFTPSTKAESGHDRTISVSQLRGLVGEDLAGQLERHSLALYRAAESLAADRGIIVADTKFEFGFIDGTLCVIDEMLTPDSSRFWDAQSYSVGEPQASFDKQFVRDWLDKSGWNKEPPAPVLPADVVERTAEKYAEAYRRITGF
ncbi:MAG: phosphoribosylaminoimidazolesuccinocarboxamide synthase [Chloroflexi bacterium]|nr:phosphoribosylaminoimidazolesuccinocarboxamide synthase [Chloroflexota bacterium]